MTTPKLSVLLSAYNAGKYVREAIRSILNQSFADFELIISDDGSNDNTRNIIDSFRSDERVVISHNDINQGKTSTINRLFELSKGEYVTIHDADDFSKPDRLEKQVSFLEENFDFVMCGCNFTYVNTKLGEIEEVLMPSDYQTIKEDIKRRSLFHGPTMIFKRNAIHPKDSLYREYFENYNEDYDLSYRLVQQGLCTNVQGFLYMYRVVPKSLSKELTPRKKAMKKIVTYLGAQRDQKNTDDLREGTTMNIDQIVESEILEYEKDKGRIHRENAELLLYFKNPKASINYGIQAFLSDPFNMANVKCFLYTIKMYLKQL